MQLKFKMNLTALKWAATIFCLMFNIVYIAPGDDITFLIVYGLIVNGLAVATFILLSIFPREFYVFNEKGISIRKGKRKEKKFIPWDTVNEMQYYYFGGYPEGVRGKYRDGYEEKTFMLVFRENNICRL